MTADLGYHATDDIGGPVGLNEGYRWNVPVVTYGFDRDFVQYFGSNGVAAVEKAIQILNDLPPASSIVLSNYPFDSRGVNFRAEAQGLSDLKSMALALLVEQMGLAEPTRNVFTMRQQYYAFANARCEDDWRDWAIPAFILERNFDPETLAPSHYVNGVLYSACVLGFGSEVYEIRVDPLDNFENAVADAGLFPGTFYTGLTRDDVGGLRFLLSRTNVNVEQVLPTVHPSRGRRILAKPRPGVEKMTFVRHRTDRKGRFKLMLLDAADGSGRGTKRVIIQPDILFSAADLGTNRDFTPLFFRTDTSRWINNANLNGNAGGAGPGIIRPPIRIVFHQLGDMIQTGDTFSPGITSQAWGSFGHSTQPLISYPTAKIPDRFSVRLRAYDTSYAEVFGTVTNRFPVQITNRVFRLEIPPGSTAALQTSTNQSDWYSVSVVTNAGAIIEWQHFGQLVDWGPPVPVGQISDYTNRVFFRVIPN